VTIYLVIPFLLTVAFLQTTVMPHLVIWGVFPDLPLLVVASWGLLQGPREGVIWGFVVGVAVDLFSGAPFGAATLGLLAVGFLAGLAGTTVFRGRAALPLLTVFLGTIIHNLIFLLVVWISGQTVLWFDSLSRVTLVSAVLNTVLTPLVYWPLHLVHTRIRRQQMEW
jgi:rod shape-determining protein MreD